ncbi:hypothetical protein GRJ2_002850300 [Grus japonensis]|uniref:Uncharacterized protein n=1 Tax=Grus japonensis TaxID=30415 RepID=A0ABC9Y516_GRUJA
MRVAWDAGVSHAFPHPAVCRKSDHVNASLRHAAAVKQVREMPFTPAVSTTNAIALGPWLRTLPCTSDADAGQLTTATCLVATGTCLLNSSDHNLHVPLRWGDAFDGKEGG